MSKCVDICREESFSDRAHYHLAAKSLPKKLLNGIGISCITSDDVILKPSLETVSYYKQKQQKIDVMCPKAFS